MLRKGDLGRYASFKENFMENGNLPPGVTVNDLPGNRPIDEEWDKFYEEVDGDCDEMSLYPDQARIIWKMGKVAYMIYRENYQE